jgi:DNA polymerase-3 subunit gamma/tau
VAYQSLYRRYRPQKFSEMRGQEHVVKALRNAVREDRVGHAYLLSGPRGTGKTTAARILAKVLNCENPQDGEPDGTCASCQSIEAGTSFDLHELDAASNNKVDDIRDLLAKVALGTPGRTKVYLLDEVHMLTSGAENALLKTLEEPPDHVVFVLATTEPHKVVPTIRSRTQQLELTLIGADDIAQLVRDVATDAGLDVDENAVGHVVKTGGGSARDTLSALDQVVAAGGVTNADESTADLLEALATNDAALAMRAIEAATERGVDSRRIGERFIDALRTVFLVKMGSVPPRLSEPERELADRWLEALSPATITRSLETVGRSLVDMRQAPDPRIDLEVAFVRICDPTTDASVAALTARVEALEATLAGGAPITAAAAPAPMAASAPAQPTAEATVADTQQPAPAPAAQAAPPAEERPTATPGASPADVARAALRPRSGGGGGSPAASRKPTPTAPAEAEPRAERPQAAAPPPPSMRNDRPAPSPAPEPAATPAEEPAPDTTAHVDDAPLPDEPMPDEPMPEEHEPAPAPVAASGGGLSLEQVREGWNQMLDGQSTKARARFLAGEVQAVEGNVVTFVLPIEAQLKRCAPFTSEIEAAIESHFGHPATISLTTGPSMSEANNRPRSGQPTQQASNLPAEDEVDIHDLTDADVGNSSVVERITDVFPGAEVLAPPEN